MSFLDKIQTGKKEKPPRIIVYGPPGIGKSTFASGAPTPVFVQTEDGLDHIECSRFPKADCYEDVRQALFDLRTQEHDFRTVVIDSIDWLERLIWSQLCQNYGVNSIEKVDKGYGKGYTYALKYWTEIIESLDILREQKGMVSILIAHAKIEKFDDPESSSYDRYSPRLHKHASDLLTEWSDAVLFATRKVRTTTEELGFNKKRTTAVAIGKAGGDRILRAVGGPACIAKNRLGITDDLDLTWDAFVSSL